MIADELASPQDPGADATWNLADLFSDGAAYQATRQAVSERLASLDRFRGRVARSSRELAEALDEVSAVEKQIGRLRAYASMRSDSDTRVAPAHATRQEAELLATEFASRTSFVVPEVASLSAEQIERFLDQDRGLLPHAQFLRDVARRRGNILSGSEERLLAEAGLMAGGPSTLFGLLHNADLPRPDVVLSSGERVRLTPANFALHRASTNPEDRRRVFEEYFDAYAPYRRTFGQNLFECVKGHLFPSRARRYDSCLEAALDDDHVPAAVYRGLIHKVRVLLPQIHRYFRLRRGALRVERLAYHDLYAPLASAPSLGFTPADARRLLRDALSPLGDDYGRSLDQAFAGRWIDWHPAAGKRAGAYASGSAYDVHPYVLLNFNGNYESVSTLAHEMGHALHSHFSNRSQPFPMAGYAIFVAEVASTFNEILFNQAMRRSAESREKEIFLIGSWIDDLRATLFRQTMFAEFELAIHDQVERGEALTGDSLSETYLQLLRFYHGHDAGVVEVHDRYAIEWATVPHFYYNFYVYQYATGIVAAMTLTEKVASGDESARSRYLAFLSSGGSDYPLALLRRAGVNLETEEPYRAATRVFENSLDRLETLLDASRQ